ncbi:PEP/pyruvate-binding domain-containing protein [Phytomonospora endophytica]|uniref:Pyruvate,water dikinase n=1 Tax=Phytomonospora endophytica TaxID=714109 RepID=A0A841FLG5_9ACTN|nr:PEP/pyruvate-binding domain-containing protein [Phytomonospora endophytica]MBB6033459.1 pyruvate,water dikinase [Phytomonospora endophytica]GIG65022.1 phosphoenolpyruvate synthase [Phytomonospora endophytica]
MTALVLPLAEIGPERFEVVGGKAANLGVLTRAGFPVPPGFCLTTEAYARVVADVLDPVLDAFDVPGADLPALAARARELVTAAEVPTAIAEAVTALADDNTPYAVRSSATAEDLPNASFAGQQDTYLNVVGAPDLLDAVRRCWASLWTERAVTYRDANDIGHRAVRLAVVIQRMVASETAGVMFTADPVTGRRRQIVIDAAPGLGEAVVSGSVNPDHFVVDPGGRVIERRLGDKTVAVRPLPGGGTETLTLAGTGEPCLTDARIRALAELGRRVEEHYGSPQDTEWAIDADGKLWLTQARPITTLYPLPDNPHGTLRAYLSVNVAQGMFRPFTPMGVAAVKVLAAGAARDIFGQRVTDVVAGPPAFAVSAGRVLGDLTEALRNAVGRRILPRVFDVMEARSAVAVRGLLDRPEFAVRKGSTTRFARRFAATMWRHRLPLRVLSAIARPAAARARVDRAVGELPARLPAPTGSGRNARLDHVEAVLATEFGRVLPTVAPPAAAGFAMLGLAARLLGERARDGELPIVLRALPHNVTTEMDLALWHLAARLREDPPTAALLLTTPAAELAARRGDWPPALADGLGGFLAVYGHRAVAEIDLGMPRWSEDPTHILGVLANYLRADPRDRAPDVLFARGADEAEAMIGELAARCGPVRGRLVRFALGRTRELAGLREMPKYWLVSSLAAMRAELAAVGAGLVRDGLLDEPGDVFYLDLTDVRDPGGELRPLVARRKEDHAREVRRRHLPRVLLSDGTEPEAVAAEAPDGALTGTPASPGRVTGIARVVLDPVGAHLEPGEILVAPSTDPGWTPLFLTAGALVMEMGGANSHGAVVAREYGIPAVVGVRDAVAAITTGQRVTVDGTSGTVAVEAGEEAHAIA